MGIMNQKVAAERASGVVVDAAGAVGYVAHYEGADSGAEGAEDVGDGGGVEEEALREL